MKKILFICLITTTLMAQQKPFVANYDESKVGQFTLPDPLRLGSMKISTEEDWEKNRATWLTLFADHMYGQMPPKSIKQTNTLVSQKDILGGKATQSIWKMDFAGKVQATVVVILPKSNKKAPVFLGLNFCGNQTISQDEGIPIFDKYVVCNNAPDFINNISQAASRGEWASRWQIEKVIDAGFGTITAACGDFEEDFATGFKNGLRTKLAGELGLKPEEWTANGAWAWGLSRMLDLAQSIAEIDGKKVILHGHSRLGKAALWAGANDRRFAAIISNESGEGGAALSRRIYGETIWRITNSFPHWFLPTYATYADRENELPFDQHILLSLLAPRPVYVASAFGDQWSDPKGEFLGTKEMEKVYSLYGKKGLGNIDMPGLNQPVGKLIRYHIRDGKHDINDYDWDQYIKFGKEEVK
ncbi:acetylxylan esterase [Cytophagaceae bacterium 50C-KIRBA]|uniref:Acetylxylan esterase n=1 Tax=Aquirufa beregesia TaxID=2516556 RepID=A0ABX0F0K0_9BACT|nr:acetylxylan esterase [Aquirufa beregesia]NGZ45292.1 acetylxylan esterase [Aquirufa beregesia]